MVLSTNVSLLKKNLVTGVCLEVHTNCRCIPRKADHVLDLPCRSFQAVVNKVKTGYLVAYNVIQWLGYLFIVSKLFSLLARGPGMFARHRIFCVTECMLSNVRLTQMELRELTKQFQGH